MNPKHFRPGRQLERSAKAISKQRAALQDYTRPVDQIRKPYQMRTSEFERRKRILAHHEAKFATIAAQIAQK